jgi:hypothetical protein
VKEIRNPCDNFVASCFHSPINFFQPSSDEWALGIPITN